jgi:hypothetical protein
MKIEKKHEKILASYGLCENRLSHVALVEKLIVLERYEFSLDK